MVKDHMEFIWGRIPKQPDGETIRYLKADLDYLYHNGFVDAKRFTPDQWRAAFKSFEQPDGNYILNKDQFLSLRPFRFVEQNYLPFNAMLIQEGPWSDEKLQWLYDKSIANCSMLTAKTFWTYINTLKKNPKRRDEKGNFIIDQAVKIGLFQLIEDYPSPRQRLEIEVQRIRRIRDNMLKKQDKDRDVTNFSVGQSTREATLENYQNFVASKSSAEQTTPTPEGDDNKKVDIKKLKKPSEKFYG